jgi:hypothetical protein
MDYTPNHNRMHYTEERDKKKGAQREVCQETLLPTSGR